jgi:4-hydroxy-2-oxoheptanedioate aldolase
MTTTIRTRLTQGATLFGTFCSIPHPAATEMMAGGGFDFLCVDAEHSAIDRGRAEEMLRAASAQGTPALVRTAGNSPELIGGALDSGAAGVLVPRVNTADEARAAVAATRYPPRGTRGAGPGRASGYGSRLTDYLAEADDEILLAVQIETEEAVKNSAEIAAVDGIDLLFIGPGDLSVSLGSSDTVRMHEAMLAILETARSHGRISGIFRPNADDAAEWVAAGATFLIIGADSVHMMQASAESVAAARRAVEGV